MVKARLRTEDGISIEVETTTPEYEEALATTLRAIRRASAAAATESSPSSADLQQLVEKLSSETVEYLRLLVENPDGLSDEEITQLLRLETRQKLAGMNGAVTKAADGLGMDSGDIIRRTVSRGPNGRSYQYVIPKDMRLRLANVLPEEPEAVAPPPTDDGVPF